MRPHARVTSITFSDETIVSVGPSDVVVIVGPNNSGKSASLRFIRDRFRVPGTKSPVVSDVAIECIGTVSEVFEWLSQIARAETVGGGGVQYEAFGIQLSQGSVHSGWVDALGLGDLARFFCHMLTADERLQTANHAPVIAVAREAPLHPIHFLLRDDGLEEKISRRFREAFGVDLIVHRHAGSVIPLMCGERPVPKEGQDRASLAYIQRLEELPELSTQGDGMRSFAGVLLYTLVGGESVLLIDEPEAFLHPPQARLLGRMLARDAKNDQQLWVATHSGDILRGMLDANSGKPLRIIRLQRRGSMNVANELKADEIASYWADPLLRHSNILDGIFHEKVILCESDSDNRFYAAVTDSIHEDADTRQPDVMFTHCGGKDRMPMAIRALARLGVPTVAVADFDVLRDEKPLRQIIEALSGSWADYASDWRLVKSSIESKKPELTSDEVRSEIDGVLVAVQDSTFPDSAKKRILEIFRRSSPWQVAKSVGKSYIPNGQPTQALERLLRELRLIGMFVVEVGELEGFDRSTGGHGPTWVNQVLQKDLRSNSAFAVARSFVREFLR